MESIGTTEAVPVRDAKGNRIKDPAKIGRIEALVIPPAWQDVWISPRAGAKLQTTGIDSAGRRQYLYHPDYGAQSEQGKFDKLVRFADHLPELRAAMAEHIDLESLEADRICGVAVRLINMGWFRVGSERYARNARTHGITTLTKSHVKVRSNRVSLSYRGKGAARIRAAVVDSELAAAVRELLELEGGSRLFRFRRNGDLICLSAAHLNDYIRTYLGEEFTAKDFRTWEGPCSRPSVWPSGVLARARPRPSGRSQPSSAALRSAWAIRLQSHAPPVSVPQSSSSTSTDARSRIFVLDVCESSVHENWASIPRSSLCSVYCDHGVFDARALLRDFWSTIR